MKTSGATLTATILALSLASTAARADWIADNPLAWLAGGLDNLLNGPIDGPPWAVPVPVPRYGCYFTRTRLNGAWRREEVCY
ncbi:MAG: hypothetical protein JO223_06295 [Hyphomicrobiales bacterium]|nr:hypothetical protein [Hyphomicrobiales bacterium]MBV8442512.1 hypothetical protein [Hyphomicrobiales bacterium]